jgi:succinate dehydrogenase / fumarate reductase cytochrome b subunit
MAPLNPRPTSKPPLHPRPLSPHLQIFKIQITSLLSLGHRLTGIWLCISGFVWCTYLATWPFRLGTETVKDVGFSLFVWIFLGGFLLALFYHLLSGIRHLVWDLGRGFRLSQVYFSAWVVLGGTLVLTIGTLCFLI